MHLSNRVYKYIDAPYYFYKTTDGLKKPVTSADFIAGGIPHSELSYVSNRAHLHETNDKNARIRYVDPAYINKFVNAFKDLINR